MDMNLGKLWEMMSNREAWNAAVHGVTKIWTWHGNWTTTTSINESEIKHFIFIILKWPKVKVKSCLTPCNPMDCSLPGSSVHGIFQARILEWVAISFSRSSQPRDWTQVSHIVGFTIWVTKEVKWPKSLFKIINPNFNNILDDYCL